MPFFVYRTKFTKNPLGFLNPKINFRPVKPCPLVLGFLFYRRFKMQSEVNGTPKPYSIEEARYFFKDHRVYCDQRRNCTLTNYWLNSWYNFLRWAMDCLGWTLLKHKNKPKFGIFKVVSEIYLSDYEWIKKEAKRRDFKLENWSREEPTGKGFFDWVPRYLKNTENGETIESWQSQSWQKIYFWCDECAWEGYDWKPHYKSTGHIKKSVQLARILIIPHFICPECSLKIPEFYLKDKDYADEGRPCPSCGKELFPEQCKYVDPKRYGDRVCLECLKIYKLNKFRAYAQGYLCPLCLEKREDRLKKRKKRACPP